MTDTFIRYVDIIDSDAKSTKTLSIHQEKVGDVGCVVWDAALVLAYYIQTQKARDRYIFGKNVIELGSGTGIVGLVAAASGAKCVVLSDLPDLLPLLRKNITENQKVINKCECEIEAFQLQWGNLDDINAITKNCFEMKNENVKDNTFHCVLVADCVYYDEAVEPLAITINHLITSGLKDTYVLCCFEERDTGNKQELQEHFRHLLCNRFNLKIENVLYSEMHEDFRSPDIHILCISR